MSLKDLFGSPEVSMSKPSPPAMMPEITEKKKKKRGYRPAQQLMSSELQLGVGGQRLGVSDA